MTPEPEIVTEPKPKIPRKDFVAKIRLKYPQYKDIGDDELVDKIVAKYPVYADTVEPLKKKEETVPGGPPYQNPPETHLLAGQIDLSKPLPDSFSEEADKKASLDQLQKQWEDQQRSNMTPTQREISEKFGLNGEKFQAHSEMPQYNTTEVDQAKAESQLRENIGIDQADTQSEGNPFTTFLKSATNAFGYQLPSGIAGFLSAASRPSRTRPEFRNAEGGIDEEKYAKAMAKNDEVKGNLLKWAEKRQGEGQELTKDLVSTLDKIDDPIDLLNWVSYAGGQAAGQIPPALATFGASSIGQEVGSIYLESVQKIAKDKGLTIDQVITKDLDNPALAMAYGTAAGALDYMGAKNATSIGKNALKNSLRTRALETLKTGGVEAGTEYAQSWIEQIGKSQAAGDDLGKAWEDANTDETAKERIESLAQGGVGGAGAHIVAQSPQHKPKENARPESGSNVEITGAPTEKGTGTSVTGNDKGVVQQSDKGDGNKTEPSKKNATTKSNVNEEKESIDKQATTSEIEKFVDRMKEGTKPESADDLQFYENNKEEIEKRLKESKAKEDEQVHKPVGDTKVSETSEKNGEKTTITETDKSGSNTDADTGKISKTKESPKEGETRPISENDSPGKARKEGKIVKEGIAYERQKPLEGEEVVKGSSTKLEFANKVNEEGEYAVVEANKIQPSHKKGIQNTMHFLPESQPKSRDSAFSQAGVKGAQDIAAKLEPEKVASSPNPYSGAPTVNTRGEVIQGNSRADALQQYWENNGDKDPSGYKKYLIDNAEQFGLDPQAIAKMKNPVLTRMVKSSDARAIELGQYTASDIETGGKRRIEPVHTVNKLTPEDRTKLATTIAQSEGETLSEIIRANTDKILDILYKRGAITETQLETVRNSRTGEINKEGVEDLAMVFRHMMFEGGDTNLGEIFESLPDPVQKGLDKAVPAVIKTKGLNNIVNRAIVGYREFLKSGMDDINVWSNQADMFNDGYSPNQVYSPEEMSLIKLFHNKKQGEISSKIKEVATHMAGSEGDMFTGPTKGLSSKEAFQKTFVDKGLPENTDSDKPIKTSIKAIGKDKFSVVGDTYTIKDRIQALGGVWDKKTQRWIFNNKVRPEVEKMLDQVQGRNPQAQFAGKRFDGRTIKQVETALKRIGKVQMNALVRRLMSKFPGISEVVMDKKRFKAVWEQYLKTGSPEAQSPADAGIPNGFAYGDKIYLNPDIITIDTPIHEFGHIWWNIARHKYPVLYAAGQRLIKGSPYLKEVEANPGYSNLSEAMKSDEAIVVAIGEKGAEIADKSAWSRLWSDLWSRIKQGLGIKHNLDMATMSLNDLVSMAAKELMTPGEIGYISSLHLPESASFRLKGYRVPEEAWQDWNNRVQAEKLINLKPENWSRAVKSNRQAMSSAFLRGVQDSTRPMAEVQNEIVDSYMDKQRKGIAEMQTTDDLKRKLLQVLNKSKKQIKDHLIGDSKDIHGLMDLMTGKTEYQIRKMKEFLFGKSGAESGYGSIMEFLTKNTTLGGKNVLDGKSLASRAHSQGLTLLDIGFYMQVVHSLERNEHNRKTSEGDIQAGSGMTDTEAMTFLDEIKKSGKEDALKSFAAEVRDKLILEPLNFMYQADMINDKDYNYLKNYYSNYVPLRVEEFATGAGNGTGQLSKGVWGSGVKKSHGSEENRYWNRVNPIVQLINNYEATLARIESNEVMKKFMKLVKDSPNDNVWKIIRPKKVMTDVETSSGDIIHQVQDFNSNEEKRAIEESSVGVRVAGKQYYIWLKDKDLREMFVEKKTRPTNPFMVGVIKTLQSIYTYQRLTYIGLNIDFPLANFVRDIQDATMNLQPLEVKKIGRKVFKGIPAAARTIFKENVTKTDEEEMYAHYLEEMRSEGGEISWLDMAGTPEIRTQVENEIKRFQDLTTGEKIGNATLWPTRKLMRAVVVYNKIMEQSIRLSTYANLRESGASRHQAAKASKNVTVNFNKKGSWGTWINMAWLFGNAGIQGASAMMTSLIKSPKVRAGVTAFVVATIANRFILAALAEDDDDMKKLLTESDHNKNFVLWVPFSKNKVMTIPVSYNLRAFKAIGDALYDMHTGNKDIGQGAGYVLKNFTNSIFPMSENYFYPTLAVPLVENKENKRFYNDQPIMPDKKHLSDKDSELYFKSTSKPFIKLSGMLSEAVDGNDDMFEISPNTMEYAFDYTLGGLKSYAKFGEEMYDVANGEQMDINKIPVIRRFVTDLSNQDWRGNVRFRNLYTELNRRRLSQEQFNEFTRIGAKMVDDGKMNPKEYHRKLIEVLKLQALTFDNNLIVEN